MEQARHKRLYDLHSWTGLVLGLMIFLVSFTGCVALFDEEIQAWEDPAERITLGAEQVAIDPLVRGYLTELEQTYRVDAFNLIYPSEYSPYFALIGNAKPLEGGRPIQVSRRWNPHNGEIIPERGDGVSYWLLDIHRRLMLPNTIGRSLVGIVGMALLLSILTGIVIHLKFMQEAFKWRMFRSVRLRWQDAHKVLGLWGMPFFTMIGFTGALLGVISLLSPIVALIAFKGDQEGLIAAVIGEEAERTGVQVQMVSFDQLRSYRYLENPAQPDRVIVENYGDESANMLLYFLEDQKLARFALQKIEPETGAVIPGGRETEHTPATRVTDAVTALHYGTYGGFPLKVIYLMLGLGLCLVTSLGMMLWVERRANGTEGKRSAKFYERLGRFNSGAMLGIIPATLTPFYLDKLYVGAEPNRLFWTGVCYLVVWLASITLAMVWGMFRSNPYQLTRHFFMACALLLLGLPVVNGIVTGDWLTAIGSPHSGSAAIADWVFAMLGVLMIAAWKFLPSHRPEITKRQARLCA